MANVTLAGLTLDEVWQALLHPSLHDLPLPIDPGLVCDDCRLVRLNVLPARSRCCTFTPDLPSFLVGAALAEAPKSEGARRLSRFIDEGRGDPLHLYAPPRHKLLHRAAAMQGTRACLPCPLFAEAEGCTIYPWRPYLCAGYQCAHVSAAARAAWSALTSLFVLHSAVLSQLLVEALGLERERLIDAWALVDDEASAWEGDGLVPVLGAELWQGRAPRDYYLACHGYVRAHAATLRGEVDGFRRAQLVRHLRSLGELTREREREIMDGARDPLAREPPARLAAAFGAGPVDFGAHRFTVPEHEGFLLWLTERAQDAERRAAPLRERGI